MSPARELLDRSKKVLPGGVNSPVRAFRAVGGEPIFAREAHGAVLTDVGDRKYIDYLMSWGALLHGHDHPAIRSAVTDAVGRGTSYGLTCPAEVELAEPVVRRVPPGE